MTDITLSEDLVDRIETRLGDTEFDSPDEFAEHVLGEVVTRMQKQSDSNEDSTVSREEVQQRLESLGYLEE